MPGRTVILFLLVILLLESIFVSAGRKNKKDKKKNKATANAEQLVEMGGELETLKEQIKALTETCTEQQEALSSMTATGGTASSGGSCQSGSVILQMRGVRKTEYEEIYFNPPFDGVPSVVSSLTAVSFSLSRYLGYTLDVYKITSSSAVISLSLTAPGLSLERAKVQWMACR